MVGDGVDAEFLLEVETAELGVSGWGGRTRLGPRGRRGGAVQPWVRRIACTVVVEQPMVSAISGTRRPSSSRARNLSRVDDRLAAGCSEWDAGAAEAGFDPVGVVVVPLGDDWRG